MYRWQRSRWISRTRNTVGGPCSRAARASASRGEPLPRGVPPLAPTGGAEPVAARGRFALARPAGQESLVASGNGRHGSTHCKRKAARRGRVSWVVTSLRWTPLVSCACRRALRVIGICTSRTVVVGCDRTPDSPLRPTVWVRHATLGWTRGTRWDPLNSMKLATPSRKAAAYRWRTAVP